MFLMRRAFASRSPAFNIAAPFGRAILLPKSLPLLRIFAFGVAPGTSVTIPSHKMRLEWSALDRCFEPCDKGRRSLKARAMEDRT
jgi:hypothetical protein